MYRMPTELKSGNEVVIRGVISPDGRLNIEFRNDTGIIFKMNVSLGGQNEDKIEFTPNTNTTYKASDQFVGENYTVKFKSYGDKLSVFVSDSNLDTVQLNNRTEDIKYLMINGQVMELSFLFLS